MKQSTKGAVAASAAGILLLGGAGSLAYWTSSADVNGGSITAGALTLTAGSCDANWVYAPGNSKANQNVVLFVPGDTITKKCTYTVVAKGDNLKATVSAPATVTYTSTPANTSLKLTPTTTFTVGAANATNPPAIADGGFITSANNGNTITATITVAIPLGSNETTTPKVNANDTQNILATLDKLTVSVQQVQG